MSILLVLLVATGFIGVWVYLLLRANPPLSTPAVLPTLTSNPAANPSPTQAGEMTEKINPLPSDQIVVHPEQSDEYLANPGIGWQTDRSDPESASRLPETVSYIRKEVSWMSLNPAEGVFNWTLLDALIESAAENGKDISFRVYTMMGDSFGGAVVPQWVLDKGAVLLPEGEPDYSNCVYQQEWGVFVDELRQRYDGNMDIAYIDISGYGNFNEWSWRNQTQWDDVWAKAYEDGKASSSTITNLDSQARRRLADMFIGGASGAHQCHTNDGGVMPVSYSYEGFQSTQLIMPYAGIQQSIQYVTLRRADVGFRYDCLGRDSDTLIGDLSGEIARIWPAAPVVFEFCQPDEVSLDQAGKLLAAFHGSLIHDNADPFDSPALEDLLRNIGYRYYLKEAEYSSIARAGEEWQIELTWQNLGNAPAYARMGHSFELRLSLLDTNGNPAWTGPLEANVMGWMPAANPGEAAPEYAVSAAIPIPADLPAGEYVPAVQIVDLKTGQPIQLAIQGQVEKIYQMDAIQVVE